MSDLFGLGRLEAQDHRDGDHEMRPRAAPGLNDRYWWHRGYMGAQGTDPICVGVAWMHLIEDGPRTWRDLTPETEPIMDPHDLYRSAQRRDEWDGTAYDGTSVRAGAKVLKDAGLITEYRWAWDVTTIARSILADGPVVIGSPWYNSMFTPRKGWVRVDEDSGLAGGHAYVLNGVNLKEYKFRIKNSWAGWGANQHAYMGFGDMEVLMELGYVEACIAVEPPEQRS